MCYTPAQPILNQACLPTNDSTLVSLLMSGFPILPCLSPFASLWSPQLQSYHLFPKLASFSVSSLLSHLLPTASFYLEESPHHKERIALAILPMGHVKDQPVPFPRGKSHGTSCTGT